MGVWTKELREGDRSQTTGCLHDYKGFCCLGVRRDIEGTEWLEGNTSYKSFYSDKGDGFHDLLPSVAKQKEWGLHRTATSGELKLVEAFLFGREGADFMKHFRDWHQEMYEFPGPKEPKHPRRVNVLSWLNDEKLDFKGIADILDLFGWDNSDSEA